MKMARPLRSLAVVAALALATAACGSLDSTGGSSAGTSGGSGTATVKIGYITPLTGPLAAFGEGDQYVVDQMTSYFKSNPIQAGGQSYGVEIILKDSQSDPKRAGEVAVDDLVGRRGRRPDREAAGIEGHRGGERRPATRGVAAGAAARERRHHRAP